MAANSLLLLLLLVFFSVVFFGAKMRARVLNKRIAPVEMENQDGHLNRWILLMIVLSAKNFIEQSVFEKCCFVAAVCLYPIHLRSFYSLSIEFLSILFSGSLHIQPLLLNLGEKFSTDFVEERKNHRSTTCLFVASF